VSRQRTAEVRQQARYVRTLNRHAGHVAWFKGHRGSIPGWSIRPPPATPTQHRRTLWVRRDFDLHTREHAEAFRAGDVEVMTSRRQKTMEEPQSSPLEKSGWKYSRPGDR